MKKISRKKKYKRLHKSFLKYKADVRIVNPEADFKNFALYQFKQQSFLPTRPKYSELIQYLLLKDNCFGSKYKQNDNEYFLVPQSFSLNTNYKETSNFLKKLFNALHHQTFQHIYIDYSQCKHIDVCASMCMDIILSDFIDYYNQNIKARHKIMVDDIVPINYNTKEIEKILFSIGAFRSIKGFKIDYDDVIAFPIIVGSKKNKSLSQQRDIDITKTVDYIIQCLKKMNKNLTGPAETNFYKVLGEVIQNAEEHSNTNNRYSIGYFEKKKDEEFGVFNLSILNFGNTIYETFTDPNCSNIEVADQMRELSKKYTSKNLFSQSKFEEETLWTLYALQDGVTRIADWDRGNGAIRFIEAFFKLKGTDDNDNISKMNIISGHTRIIFDGKYNIVTKPRGKENKLYKMMTFNDTGNIEDKPDSTYVKYEKNYFPGTLISAKIRIDLENTEELRK